MKGNVTMTGYWPDSPDRNNDFNVIPDNKITMKGMDKSLLGVSNTGDTRIMRPGEEHQFDGNYVLEMPLNNMNNRITDPTVIQRLIDNHKQMRMRNGGSLRIYQGDTDASTVPPDPPMMPITGLTPYALQTNSGPQPYMFLPKGITTGQPYQALNVPTDQGIIDGNMQFDPATGKLSTSFPVSNYVYALPEMNIVGKPSRSTQFNREFTAQNPDPNAWNDSADPNSPVLEKFLGGLLGIGKTGTNPYTGKDWGYYNRQTNYENAKTNYIAEKLLEANPQGVRNRQEWLASFGPTELETIRKSKKYSGEVAPNKWAEGTQGMLNYMLTGPDWGYADKEREAIPNLFPEQLSPEEKNEAGILAGLGMMSIPAEGLKGWITEGSGRGWAGASPIDYTGGRDVITDLAGDVVFDPLNLVGIGIGKQALRGVRAAKPLFQGASEIGVRSATGLMNKGAELLESQAGRLAGSKPIQAYEQFANISPEITARAAEANMLGGARDYTGRTYTDMYNTILNSRLPEDELTTLLNRSSSGYFNFKTRDEALQYYKELAEQDAKLAQFTAGRPDFQADLSYRLNQFGVNDFKNLDVYERERFLDDLTQAYNAKYNEAPPAPTSMLPDSPAKPVETLAPSSTTSEPIPSEMNQVAGAGPQAGAPAADGKAGAVIAQEDLPPEIGNAPSLWTLSNNPNAGPSMPIPQNMQSYDELTNYISEYAKRAGLSKSEAANMQANLQRVYGNFINDGLTTEEALAKTGQILGRKGNTWTGAETIGVAEAMTKRVPRNADEAVNFARDAGGLDKGSQVTMRQNVNQALAELQNQGLSKQQAFEYMHTLMVQGDMPVGPLSGWNGVGRNLADITTLDDTIDGIVKAYGLQGKQKDLFVNSVNDWFNGQTAIGHNQNNLMVALNNSDNPFTLLSSQNMTASPEFTKAFESFIKPYEKGGLQKFTGFVNKELRAGRRAANRNEFITPTTKKEFGEATGRTKEAIVKLGDPNVKFTPSTETGYVGAQEATSSLFATSFPNERKMLEYVTGKLDGALSSAPVGKVITGSANTSHNSYVVQMDYIMKAVKNPANAGKIEPVFLGFQPMNTMGYMSVATRNSAAGQEDILRLINNKLNGFQKKTGVNLGFENKFPYIDDKGRIMLPQWGIKKLVDGPITIKKKYGGEVGYSGRPFMGYLPIDYMKAYGA